ncbi:hypothetical protein HYFRA_00005093 [Hymenoscyphus fraxineus]|uniref:RNase MRP protein 1 RNA binding domain-containing protein n=1 Tax=Hymenoscyphus fraxineus TaxID=746836 RepID=A0A9N9L856_9HELO|nr:hypothetical protein HYFRA_00005093 [Hymenoscyphus fraxineus]
MRMLCEMTGTNEYGIGKSKKESKFTIAAREKLGARIEFLTRYMVGRWYLAFTTLTADNQYAALGLMLLGSLARFQTVIKQVAKEINLVLDKDLEIPEIIQSREGISDLGLLQGKGDVGEVISREAFGPLGLEGRDVDDGEGEDVGSLREKVVKEKKRRNEVVEDVESEGNDGASNLLKRKKKRKESGEEVVSVKGESTAKVKKAKKKKKKGDAFDDLFGGLI